MDEHPLMQAYDFSVPEPTSVASLTAFHMMNKKSSPFFENKGDIQKTLPDYQLKIQEISEPNTIKQLQTLITGATPPKLKCGSKRPDFDHISNASNSVSQHFSATTSLLNDLKSKSDVIDEDLYPIEHSYLAPYGSKISVNGLRLREYSPFCKLDTNLVLDLYQHKTGKIAPKWTQGTKTDYFSKMDVHLSLGDISEGDDNVYTTCTARPGAKLSMPFVKAISSLFNAEQAKHISAPSQKDGGHPGIRYIIDLLTASTKSRVLSRVYTEALKGKNMMIVDVGAKFASNITLFNKSFKKLIMILLTNTHSDHPQSSTPATLYRNLR